MARGKRPTTRSPMRSPGEHDGKQGGPLRDPDAHQALVAVSLVAGSAKALAVIIRAAVAWRERKFRRSAMVKLLKQAGALGRKLEVDAGQFRSTAAPSLAIVGGKPCFLMELDEDDRRTLLDIIRGTGRRLA